MTNTLEDLNRKLEALQEEIRAAMQQEDATKITEWSDDLIGRWASYEGDDLAHLIVSGSNMDGCARSLYRMPNGRADMALVNLGELTLRPDLAPVDLTPRKAEDDIVEFTAQFRALPPLSVVEPVFGEMLDVAVSSDSGIDAWFVAGEDDMLTPGNLLDRSSKWRVIRRGN